METRDNDNFEQNSDIEIVEENLSDFGVFKKILFSPREAFQYINNFRYENHSSLLVALYGVSYLLDNAIDKQSGNSFSPIGLFFLILIVGPIIGFLYINFYSILLGVTGNWLGGTATINQISRVLPYTTLPSIIGIIYIILSIAFCGYQLFIDVESVVDDSSPIIGILIGLFLIFRGILSLWTLGLIIIAIAIIQNFSIKRAIVNAILPTAFLFLLVAGIFMFFRTFAFLEQIF